MNLIVEARKVPFMKHTIYLLTLCSSVLCNPVGGIFSSYAEQADSSKTNMSGIFATCVDWPKAPGGGHRVSVTIHFTSPLTNPAVRIYPTIVTNGNGAMFSNNPSKTWEYFMATNSFCGRIELRDSAGDKVRLIKSQVSDEKSYPAAYSLKSMGKILMKIPDSLSGVPLPQPLVGSNATYSFYLKDYYSIKKEGEYHLTIWPKIYQRSKTNLDLCHRIDLKPVTIPIEW